MSSPPASSSLPTTPERPAADKAPSPEKASSPSPKASVDDLISGLRASLASSQSLLSTQATRLSSLSDLEVQHQQLKDQHAFVVAAKDAVEAQLRDEVSKREAAEERVEALRGQVEQARRGVMTLQKQEKDRKRLSMAPPPAPGTGLGLNTGAEEVLEDKEEKLSRRTSIMGRKTHRRVSSHSEPDASVTQALVSPNATSPNPAAPRTGGLRELRLAPAPPTSGQLPSPLMYDDPHQTPRHTLSPPPPGTSPTEALLAARSEADRLRAQLASTQARLADSEEARKASETVLKALREFVGGDPGVVDLNDPVTMEELRGISLPPLPTDPDEPPPPEQPKPAAGWGFNKLWKPTLAPPTPGSPSSHFAEAPATPHILSPPRSVRSNSTPRASPLPSTSDLPLNESAVNAMPAQTPLASFVSSWTKTVPPGTPAAAGLTPQPPITRSFSSFFRKTTSTSGKEKELPPSPVLETGSDVGSVGAEKVDVMHESKMPVGEGLGLEPSPMSKEGEAVPSESGEAAGVVERVEAVEAEPAAAIEAGGAVEAGGEMTAKPETPKAD